MNKFKNSLDEMKNARKLKELEKSMPDECRTSGLAQYVAEYFEGNVPNYACAWFAKQGGNMFDLEQASNNILQKKSGSDK